MKVKHGGRDFIYDIKPSDKTVIIIDANAQGIDTLSMRILKTEFPQTYAAMRRAIESAASSPYTQWIKAEERHYHFAILFGLENRYGANKDTQDEVFYATTSLLKAVVKEFGSNCRYHSLYLYKEQSKLGAVNQFITNLNVDWTFYRE